MSEGESKSATAGESKLEAGAPAAGVQGVSSMSPPVSSVTPVAPAPEDEEESEDESEILEESPCGRWQKRREEVSDICLFHSK